MDGFKNGERAGIARRLTPRPRPSDRPCGRLLRFRFVNEPSPRLLPLLTSLTKKPTYSVGLFLVSAEGLLGVLRLVLVPRTVLADVYFAFAS